MNIRAMSQADLGRVREIHEKFYKEEFELPDFFKHFLCAFAIENDNGIVVAGGIRPIAECILITNKDVDVTERLAALHEVLGASKYIAHNAGFDMIHAFAQEPNWEKYLRRAGFATCKGNALFLEV